MKCGRKRRVVAHEGGRKRGVLLYRLDHATDKIGIFQLVSSLCTPGMFPMIKSLTGLGTHTAVISPEKMGVSTVQRTKGKGLDVLSIITSTHLSPVYCEGCTKSCLTTIVVHPVSRIACTT